MYGRSHVLKIMGGVQSGIIHCPKKVTSETSTEVTLRHFSFRSLWVTQRPKLKNFEATLQKPLQLLFALADSTKKLAL